MRDVKQASFRLNAEDTEKFRAFCEESEMTAAQGFTILLELLELDRAGRALPARQTEIENFEQHMKALVSAFLHSLELNENAENRIREQFSAQLESQMRTITDYQEQTSTLQRQLEEALGYAESYRSDLQALQESVFEAERKQKQAERDFAVFKDDKEKQLADKENIISMLTDKLLVAEQKAAGYDGLAAENGALKADLVVAEQTLKDAQKEAEIERERLVREAQIALERSVREAEKLVEADAKKDLDRLRSQNTELHQTIAENERLFNEQIRALDKTNGDLREMVADLKARLPQQKEE